MRNRGCERCVRTPRYRTHGRFSDVFPASAAGFSLMARFSTLLVRRLIRTQNYELESVLIDDSVNLHCVQRRYSVLPAAVPGSDAAPLARLRALSSPTNEHNIRCTVNMKVVADVTAFSRLTRKHRAAPRTRVPLFTCFSTCPPYPAHQSTSRPLPDQASSRSPVPHICSSPLHPFPQAT
jgi:hypothetical protein